MLKRGYIILLFLLSLAVGAVLTWFTYKSIHALSLSIQQSQKPDMRVAELKQFVLSVNNAESDVRSFAITRDKKYLDNYFELVNVIDTQSVSLKKIFSDSPVEIDSISSLIKKKLTLYNQLIDLRYKELMDEAVSKISGKLEDVPDTIILADTVVREKGGFFKRMFGSSKRIREMEQKAKALDSLNSMQAVKLSTIKRAVTDAKENEMKIITKLSEQELNLLEEDRQLKSALQYQITVLEEKIIRNNAHTSQIVIRETSRQMRTMMVVAIVSALLILILTIIILLDVRRTNRYKKQLELARNKAEELAKFKEDFLATMSHEIRTPLSALTGFSKKLMQTNTSSEQKQYIRTINVAGDHLLNIVNDVLDLSRIETGKLQFTTEPFSVYETVTDMHTLMSQKAAEKNISFTLDASEVKRDVVKGDALRLKQALLNVCGNAIKFTSKGSVHLHVRHVSNNYLFSIADTGIGIPEDKLSEIFNPYEQANNIEKNYGGTGLGLAITKKIVELQQGSINIESKVGKGTIITISLPYEKTNDVAAIVPEEEIAAAPELKGYKILLAEDDELNQELAATLLTSVGAEIINAKNGKQAIEKLLLENADAILMDIQMPELNGRQATIFIREHISKTIPIIGVTANMMNDAKNECVEAGMNEVILKPFEIAELNSILLPLISHHKKAQAAEVNILDYTLNSLFKTSNGKSDFVIKMLKIFLSSNSKLIEKTLRFTDEKNYEQAAATVHRLIPSFRQLGMEAFAAIFKNIEWLLLNAENKSSVIPLLNSCWQQFLKLEKKLTADIAKMEQEARSLFE